MTPAKKRYQKAFWLRFKTKNQIMMPRFRFHICRKKTAKALFPVRSTRWSFFRLPLFLTQLFIQAQCQGSHMAANARKRIRTITLMACAAVRNGKIQARCVNLKIFTLNDTLHIPRFSLLNIYFLHLAFRKNIIGCITNIFRHTVMQKCLTHIFNDVLLRSAHVFLKKLREILESPDSEFSSDN